MTDGLDDPVPVDLTVRFSKDCCITLPRATWCLSQLIQTALKSDKTAVEVLDFTWKTDSDFCCFDQTCPQHMVQCLTWLEPVASQLPAAIQDWYPNTKASVLVQQTLSVQQPLPELQCPPKFPTECWALFKTLYTHQPEQFYALLNAANYFDISCLLHGMLSYIAMGTLQSIYQGQCPNAPLSAVA